MIHYDTILHFGAITVELRLTCV